VTAVRLLATRQLEAQFGQVEPEEAVCTQTVCCEPSLFTP